MLAFFMQETSPTKKWRYQLMKKLIATSMAIALALGVQAGGVDAATPTKAVKQAYVYQLNNEQLNTIFKDFNSNLPALKNILNGQFNCNIPVQQPQKPTVEQPKRQQPQKPVVEQPKAQQPQKQTTEQLKPQQPAAEQTKQQQSNSGQQKPATEQTNVSISQQEQQMVNLVNQERAKQGLQPLKVNQELVKVARVKAKDMIDKNYFSHQSPTYGSPFEMMSSFGIKYNTAGENLAGNQTVDAAHKALMNSEGHRANILNGNYKEIGIGIVDGGPYGKMFVQLFKG